MRLRLSALVSLALLAACGSDDPVTPAASAGPPALRVVNGFTTPIDVVIDGAVAISALPAGAIDTVAAAPGAHTVQLRAAGAATSQSVETAAGALRTVAAVRASSGGVATVALDDTNAVVPAGKTKVRVLHLAASAGTLQVFRTQPDYRQPIAWQFPFTYQAQPTSLSAPFYQSDAGTWEIRAWQTPADATGWGSAPVRVVLPLAGGEKRTVVLLDRAGGGIRAEVL